MEFSIQHNIVELFLDAAKKYPNNTAIIHEGKEITYKELESEVKSTAAYFYDKGIGEGDRVMVFVPMSIDLYRIVLALFYIGASAVFLDEWVSKERLEVCCRHAKCKGFIGVLKAQVLALYSREIRKIPIKLKRSGRSQHHFPVRSVSPDSTALITFTTGSTGVPKAADRTHSFLLEQFNALHEEIDPLPTDVDMPLLPIVLFVNLGVGCTSVIVKVKMKKLHRLKPERIITALMKHRVNRLTASPFFIRFMAEYLIGKKQEGMIYLEKIFTGGAPVFPEEAQLYKRAFPSTDTMIAYGSTEAEPISMIGVDELVECAPHLPDGLPVGIPYHKAEVKVIGWENKPLVFESKKELLSAELEEGGIGEIIVSGEHVLKAYIDNQKAFEENKIVVDGTIWHRTGDGGRIQNGQLFLVGRCKQLIRKEKTYLSPFVVENLLSQLKGVRIGTIMETASGDIVLVLETERSREELIKEIPIAEYDRIEVVKQIPRDPRHNSKIDYEQLKRRIK